MKKFLFGCAIAISGLTMPLLSANDYCCPPQCDPCCCGVDFDGFYVGGNIGVLSHTAHRNDLDELFPDNAGWSFVDTSFTAGVQVGWDWQCCNKLFGLVVDWNWADTHHRHRIRPNSIGTDDRLRAELHWFTTIRARAGLAVCDALVYITGGAAVARFENRWSNLTDDFHHHRSRWGWVAGAGTELMLGCNWSLGAEVLFMHFDTHRRTFTGVTGELFSFDHADSVWVGRILLNYRFGDLCSFCCR